MEAVLVAEASAGALGKLTLLDAALIASGTPDALMAERRARVTSVLQPVIDRARRKKAGAARGKALLRALHEQVFRRYDATKTNVWDALQTGQFNCVSSAVIYVIAAQGLMDNPRAMLMPTHAYARVTVDGKPVDVETTIDEGFDPDPRKVMTPSFMQRLGIGRLMNGKPVDAAAARKAAVELPALALIATVYSNRAVDLMDKGDSAGAVVALDRATRIAPTALRPQLATWRGTLLVNAAADLIEHGRAQDAVPLLQLGLDGTTGSTRETLQYNLALARGNVAHTKADAGALHEALADLNEALASGQKIPAVEQERARIIALLAAKEGSGERCDGMAGGDAAQCHAQVSIARLKNKDADGAVASARRGAAYDVKVHNVRIALWNGLNARADAYSVKGDCRSAEHDFGEAELYRDVVPGDPLPLREKVGGCWGALSVALHKKGRALEAMEALERALIHLPRDPTLMHNLAAEKFNRALALSNDGKCDDARPLVVSALQIDATIGSKAASVMASCAQNRAMGAWNKRDWSAATVELRRGLKDAPSHPQLKENLATALYNSAVGKAESGDCEEALGLVDEAVDMGLAIDATALRMKCR